VLHERKPEWLKVRAPGGGRYLQLKQALRSRDLYTVCEEARCPNVGECWAEGTATIMLLGDTCTRGCRFCAVTTGNPRGAYDPREPDHTAAAIAELGLSYVVLTMVNRDDLLDGGADVVARTIRALRRLDGAVLVETLTGDFLGDRTSIGEVVRARPDVFAHNVETVRRLTPAVRDPRSSFDRSLGVLAQAKDAGLLTKSSIMLGLGESLDEVHDAMRELRGAGTDILTLGQYLRPTPKHAPVVEYVSPGVFAALRKDGIGLGFRYVASGPLVRSSYKAAEAFARSFLLGSPTAPDTVVPLPHGPHGDTTH
jgi:lipoic acid synthetase